MTCNQKSALTTVSTAVQTVTANGFVNFPTNNLLTGVSIKHPAGSTSVNLIQGLYLVTKRRCYAGSGRRYGLATCP